MSAPRRIVLVNAWHDDNKGDGGIIEATLELLAPHAPRAEITVVSKFTEHHPAFAGAHRHLLAEYPAVRVLPLRRGMRPVRGRAGQLRDAFGWMVPPRGARGPDTAEGAIAAADLVVSVGGHYLYSRKADPRHWGRLHRHLYPLAVARAREVPYVFLAHSMGPFADGVSRRMVRPLLNGAHAVGLREARSDATLSALGVAADRRFVLPDVAFALEPAHTPRVESVVARHGLERPFWAFTVRGWGSGAESAAFLDQMAEAVRGVLREGLAERVALVAHCHGPTPHEDDRVATRALAERLRGLPVSAVEEDLAPRELVALYGRARAVVGTRFHSVIFALAAGTPAFAVSYFGPKAQGIMDMLGMSELCADTAGFRAAQALPRMRGLVEPAHRADVRERVARLRGELRRAVAERVIPRGAGEEAA